MYDYIAPSVAGEFILRNFVTDLENYADDCGVNLRSDYTICDDNYNACVTTIQNGLRADKPVAALNLDYPIIGEGPYPWHWTTVTKYFHAPDDQRWIAISTFGDRVSIDFDAYYDNINGAALHGGFAYFY